MQKWYKRRMADELAFKLVVVGNGAVGKSSLIQRFCRGVFSQNYKQTIGEYLQRDRAAFNLIRNEPREFDHLGLFKECRIGKICE